MKGINKLDMINSNSFLDALILAHIGNSNGLIVMVKYTKKPVSLSLHKIC